MSKCKMSLVVLCVTSATLAYPGSAGAQYFEGSGVLALAQPPEVCFFFFPDNGEFPLGLGTLGDDWGGFQLGDHIHVAGVLVSCGSFCTFEGRCFEEDAVIVAWPIVPAVSVWGMITLGLLMLAVGTIVIRSGNRYAANAGVFGISLLVTLCAPSFAQDPLIAQKVNRMLQSQHHANNMLVRFKATASQVARDALHATAGAVKIKAYRYVDGLSVSRYNQISCF